MRKIGVIASLGEGLMLPGRWACGEVELGGCYVVLKACCGCSARVNESKLALNVQGVAKVPDPLSFDAIPTIRGFEANQAWYH